MSRFDNVDNDGTTLVVHNAHNPSNLHAESAVYVTIWGGTFANCGEHSASDLVQSSRESLRKFLYIPQSHKGGRMVRPYYYKSDRVSKMTFPNLEVLGYWGDMGTPSDVNWIVPNLKVLYVFGLTDDERIKCWDTDIPIEQHQEQQQPRWRRFLLQRTLEQCPHLEEIVCARPDFEQPEEYQVLRRLVPPDPLPWECLRLLAIVQHKSQYNDDDEDCAMASLPDNVMEHVVSFCHAPRWTKKVPEKNVD